MALSKITRYDISDLFDTLKECSSKYQLNLFGLLSVMFQAAKECDLIDSIPVRRKIHRPKHVRVERWAYSFEQILAILGEIGAEYQALVWTAAEKWLTLADAGRHAECWNQSSSLSKSGIQTSSLFIPGGSEQQWQSSFAAFQADLGKAVARSLKSKQYAEELPYEPEGEHVVLKYETSFKRKGNGVETVILMKEKDGAWRVSRYNVVLGWRSIQQSGY